MTTGRLVNLVKNTQKKRKILNMFHLTQKKKSHFFSGFYTIWEEIRHSNTHKDTDTYNCVQHNVKKQQLFSSVFIGLLKIKFSVGSMLDFTGATKPRKTAELQAENFLQTRDCTRGNFVFYCKSAGFAFSRLLLLISICN